MEIEKRIEKLNVFKNKLDAIFIDNLHCQDFSFIYFTNTDVKGIFYYDFKEPKLYIPEMELTSLKSCSLNYCMLDFNVLKKDIKHKRIGINGKCLPFNISKNFKARDISKYLENMMSVKSDYEIKLLKKACKFTKQVFKKIEHSKKDEISLKFFIDKYIHTLNCRPAFETIVASGNNTKEPHHKPIHTKLSKPLLIDLGVEYKFYGSDVTRVYYSKYEHILRNVLEAIEDKLKPGLKAKDLHIFAKRLLKKYAKYFITALGHGIGIYHGLPIISAHSKDILKPYNVISIEPGIYTKIEGARIENNYLITEDECINLTDF